MLIHFLCPWLLSSIWSGSVQGSNSDYNQEIIVTFDGVQEDGAGIENDLMLTEKRPFHMGFTPFPYYFTEDAVEFTYANINYHSDLVIHHFDNGIP